MTLPLNNPQLAIRMRLWPVAINPSRQTSSDQERHLTPAKIPKMNPPSHRRRATDRKMSRTRSTNHSISAQLERTPKSQTPMRLQLTSTQPRQNCKLERSLARLVGDLHHKPANHDQIAPNRESHNRSASHEAIREEGTAPHPRLFASRAKLGDNWTK